MSITNNTKQNLNYHKVQHNWKVELTLNEQTMAQIATLHTLVPNGLEWSGRLLYKVTDGSIEDKNLKFESIGLFPCDIGTAGGTSFDIMNHFEALNDIYDLENNDYKQGILHTHHRMETFFSGTDWNDILNSASSEFKRGWCLSVIVNYAMDIQAKIAWVEESKIEIPEYVVPEKKIEIVQFGRRTPVTIQEAKVVPAQVLTETKHHIVDCDIYIQSNLNTQIDKLNKIRIERTPIKTVGKNQMVIGDGNPSWYGDVDWDNYNTYLPEYPQPKDKPQIYEIEEQVDIIEWAFYTFKDVRMNGSHSKYKNLEEMFKDIISYNVKNNSKITSENIVAYIEDAQVQYELDEPILYNYLEQCEDSLNVLSSRHVDEKWVDVYITAIQESMELLIETNEINLEEDETFG